MVNKFKLLFVISIICIYFQQTLKSADLEQADSENLLQTLESRQCVSHLSILSDGRLAAVAAETIQIWDLAETNSPQFLRGHNSNIICLQLLPDGKLASTAEYKDATIRIWDLVDPTHCRVLTGHAGPVTCLQLLPSGKLISGSSDSRIGIWDLNDPYASPIFLSGHEGGINCLSVLPENKLASSSEDGTIRIWNLADLREAPQVLRCGTRVDLLQLLPNGTLACASDGIIQIWDLEKIELSKKLIGEGMPIESLILLPNGKLVWGDYDGIIRIWNSAEPHEFIKLIVHNQYFRGNPICCLSQLPGNKMMSGSDDGTIVISDFDNLEHPIVLRGHTNRITHLQLLPDGRLVSSSWDNTIKIWKRLSNDESE